MGGDQVQSLQVYPNILEGQLLSGARDSGANRTTKLYAVRTARQNGVASQGRSTAMSQARTRVGIASAFVATLIYPQRSA